MNVTVLFNPLRGKTFPVNHHFSLSCSYWTNPFPSSNAVFPLKLNSLWFPLTEPFVILLFSGFSPFLLCKHLFCDSSWIQLLASTPTPHRSVTCFHCCLSNTASSGKVGSCGQGQPSAPARPLDLACPLGSAQEPAPGTGATCRSCQGQRFLPESNNCQKCKERDFTEARALLGT